MRLLILAVLLAVSQTSSPVPGKTTNHPARASRDAKSQATTNKAPAAPPQTSADARAAPKNANSHKAIASDNTQKTIRVGELPPVSVTKDWTDYFYWVFSLLLVVVGGLQVWLLHGTLRAIQRQADIEKALRLTERADIGLDSAGLSTGQEITGDSMVILRFKNFGHTQAKSVKFDCYLDIPFPGGLARTVPSTSDITTTRLSASNTQEVSFQRFRDYLTKESFEQIRSGQIPVSFRSQVNYRDVFGDSHKIGCRGTLNPKTLTFRYDEYRAD